MSINESHLTLAILASSSASHVVRWANALAERQHRVHWITSHAGTGDLHPRIVTHQLKYSSAKGYLLNVPQLRQLLGVIKPDILQAHYASGYGTLATLSGFQPRLISLWGIDVFAFPHRSPVHKFIFKRNVGSCDWVTAASSLVAQKAEDLYPGINHKLTVTPLGINLRQFTGTVNDSSLITIGTCKPLYKKFAVDVLIRGFALFRKSPQMAATETRLLIVGEGPEAKTLGELARSLAIDDGVTFVGKVEHNELPRYLQLLDIFVAVSRQDDWGAGVLEASAMGRPVIATGVGILPDAVIHDQTGFIIPKDNPGILADRLIKLAESPQLRLQMGANGREHMEKKFDWQKNVKLMEEIYYSLLGSERRSE